MTEDDQSAIASLIHDLTSADTSTRVRAAEKLGSYPGRPPRGGPDVIDALVTATRDPEVDVRRMSVSSLVRYKQDGRAIRALMEWFESEENVGGLFDKLAEEMNPEIRDRFVALLDAGNERTRWRAAAWLARRGDAAAADSMASLMEAPANVPKREAGLVLKGMGIPSDGYDPATLADAVLADSGSIRAAAAWGLGLIGDARALPILLPLVAVGHDAASIVPVLELILTRDAKRATEADLRAAAKLISPRQNRSHDSEVQFGPGPTLLNLDPLNLDLVHQLAETELTRRTQVSYKKQ